MECKSEQITYHKELEESVNYFGNSFIRLAL